MIIEAYMQPRPAITEPACPPPVSALISIESSPTPASQRPDWPDSFDSCGSALSQPLLVEEIELLSVSRARFEAIERDARIWAEARVCRRPARQEVPLAQEPEDPFSPADDPWLRPVASGPAYFHCRNEGVLPTLECSECSADEASMHLFRKYLERSPSFAAQGSESARQYCGERDWISEVLAESRACEAAIAHAEETSQRAPATPAWALHLEEIEVLETIDLQPVDLAILSRAA